MIRPFVLRHVLSAALLLAGCITATAAGEYYYENEGARAGPVGAAELRELGGGGSIVSVTYASGEGA